jgi:hypothetical protein
MFGLERLNTSVVRCSGMPNCVVENIHTSLYHHTGVRTRADDQTIVAIQVHNSPTPADVSTDDGHTAFQPAATNGRTPAITP